MAKFEIIKKPEMKYFKLEFLGYKVIFDSTGSDKLIYNINKFVNEKDLMVYDRIRSDIFDITDKEEIVIGSKNGRDFSFHYIVPVSKQERDSFAVELYLDELYYLYR